nr:ribonuclease 2-like isoform X2 [Ipomoea batatas]
MFGMASLPARLILLPLLLLFGTCNANLIRGGHMLKDQKEFDFFTLALAWSGTSCSSVNDCCPTNGCCRSDVATGFTINGFWPDYNDGTWPSCCDGPTYDQNSEYWSEGKGDRESDIMFQAIKKEQTAVPPIAVAEHHSGSILCDRFTQGRIVIVRQSLEWLEGGVILTCQISVISGFLNTYWPAYNCSSPTACGVFIASNLAYEEILLKAGYVPSDTVKYPLEGITSAIKNALGVTPIVKCNGHSPIREIQICFDKTLQVNRDLLIMN